MGARSPSPKSFCWADPATELPLYLLSSEQARKLDQLCTQGLGISEDALIEAAGLNAALAMEREFGALAGRRVAILCGKGNNAADGLALARHLLNQGVTPLPVLAFGQAAMNSLAQARLQTLRQAGIQTLDASGEDGPSLARAAFAGADIVVDAVLGTGSRGAVTGALAALIVALNSAGRPVLALDIPSGLDADTGRVQGACVYATVTLAMQCAKVGLALYPGRAYVGRLVVADLGLPLGLLAKLGPLARWYDESRARASVPGRAGDAHKKSAVVLVVAGSAQYLGAALLCARAAYRGGAGLVRLALPLSARQAAQTALPEAVVLGLGAAGADALGEDSADAILAAASDAHAVVLGPGLGLAAPTQALVRKLYQSLKLPCVVDADALSALDLKALKVAAPRLLTPHDGEMARLLGDKGAERLGLDRVAEARALASRGQLNLLLKGPGTLVCDAAGDLTLNATGSPALASAGSGDALAGLIGALMAQGLEPSEAGRLGAWLHGRSGELWAARAGDRGALASDLSDLIPFALAGLLGLGQ